MRLKIFITVISVIFIPLLVWYLTQDIQWLIAIITLLVGLGAIFQSYIINWLWHPELHLRISLNPNDGDCHQIPVDIYAQAINDSVATNISSYYFNLRVENKGNAIAEDVEVAILELWKKQNGSYKKVDFPPMNLFWRHKRGVIAKDRIAPLIDTHFTLGRILNPTVTSNQVLFSLLPVVEMNSNPHILLPGNYRLKIALAAKNIPTLTRTYRLWFNNTWDDKPNKMLGQNVSITPIEDVTEKEICCITLPLGRYNKVITLCRKYRKRR